LSNSPTRHQYEAVPKSTKQIPKELTWKDILREEPLRGEHWTRPEEDRDEEEDNGYSSQLDELRGENYIDSKEKCITHEACLKEKVSFCSFMIIHNKKLLYSAIFLNYSFSAIIRLTIY